MLAGSHRNAWPDETGTGGRTNRNTQVSAPWKNVILFILNAVRDLYGLATNQIAQTFLSYGLQVIY